MPDDERRLRDDPSKRQRFERLLEGPHFDSVVEANSGYLFVAVVDPEGTERERWALSCLPGGRALSRVSMSGMETFTVLAPQQGQDVEGFVVALRSVLTAEFGADFIDEFPGLRVLSHMYRSAGEDQVCVAGSMGDLLAALGREPFAVAARELAGRLMCGTTSYKNGHNYWLADHVLRRA